jgi:hypothetical protein
LRNAFSNCYSEPVAVCPETEALLPVLVVNPVGEVSSLSDSLCITIKKKCSLAFWQALRSGDTISATKMPVLTENARTDLIDAGLANKWRWDWLEEMDE